MITSQSLPVGRNLPFKECSGNRHGSLWSDLIDGRIDQTCLWMITSQSPSIRCCFTHHFPQGPDYVSYIDQISRYLRIPKSWNQMNEKRWEKSPVRAKNHEKWRRKLKLKLLAGSLGAYLQSLSLYFHILPLHLLISFPLLFLFLREALIHLRLELMNMILQAVAAAFQLCQSVLIAFLCLLYSYY